MLETAEERGNLQQLLDRSMAGAGGHPRGNITGERRRSAAELAGRAGRGGGADRAREDVHLCDEGLAPAGRAAPVRRSASAHSRAAVAASRARRGGRTVVAGLLA